MKSTKKQVKLSKEQEKWVSRHRRCSSKDSLRELIRKQEGLCQFSKVEMFFDKAHGIPPCHPLYASVDHIEPGNPNDLQIVCYALNDLKGYLPENYFKRTKAWKSLMTNWKKQDHKSRNRTAFNHLKRPNA